MFDEMHRPDDDLCARSERNDRNTDIMHYMTTDFHSKGHSDLVGLSSDHPNLRFTGGYGVAKSSFIPEDSKLRVEKSWTPRGRKQLDPRLYHANPSQFSTGSFKAIDNESGLRKPYHTHSRATALSGTFIEQQYTPLISQLRQEVQDSTHIVEPWTRGGAATREATRRLAYGESGGGGQGGATAP